MFLLKSCECICRDMKRASASPFWLASSQSSELIGSLQVSPRVTVKDHSSTGNVRDRKLFLLFQPSPCLH
eukprot:4009181-Pleurochrysis_carterae.AAC.2